MSTFYFYSETIFILIFRVEDLKTFFVNQTDSLLRHLKKPDRKIKRSEEEILVEEIPKSQVLTENDISNRNLIFSFALVFWLCGLVFGIFEISRKFNGKSIIDELLRVIEDSINFKINSKPQEKSLKKRNFDK